MSTKAKVNARANKSNANKLPTVAVWNGPALIRITLMRIQCGQMQRALLCIIMRCGQAFSTIFQV